MLDPSAVRRDGEKRKRKKNKKLQPRFVAQNNEHCAIVRKPVFRFTNKNFTPENDLDHVFSMYTWEVIQNILNQNSSKLSVFGPRVGKIPGFMSISHPGGNYW